LASKCALIASRITPDALVLVLAAMALITSHNSSGMRTDRAWVFGWFGMVVILSGWLVG
jgi:hypothetical protein